MTNSSIIGIDLAKNVFQAYGAGKHGQKRFSKKLKRAELLPFLGNQPACLVAIEACGGAHFWARQISALGHQVKIIHPRYVKAFVQVHKNDARDAQAIAEAASRAMMPSVAPKSIEQQDLQAIHRVRERLVKERTAVSNELRGILAEFGVTLPQGWKGLREGVPRALENATNELSVRGRRLIAELLEQWRARDKQVSLFDQELLQIAKENPVCRRLQSVPGIGPINATLLYSYAGDCSHFASGRHFSASLGVVPKQHASGGKEILQGISKQGNKHVRKQLVHGARAAYRSLLNKEEDCRLGQWVTRMEGKHPNVIIVALANKLARIAWAVMKQDGVYQA